MRETIGFCFALLTGYPGDEVNRFADLNLLALLVIADLVSHNLIIHQQFDMVRIGKMEKIDKIFICGQ